MVLIWRFPSQHAQILENHSMNAFSVFVLSPVGVGLQVQELMEHICVDGVTVMFKEFLWDLKLCAKFMFWSKQYEKKNQHSSHLWIKRQMFLQFLFQDLHHLPSVSMTLTVISSDRQHCRLSMMQMTARMDKWLWTLGLAHIRLTGSSETGVIAVKQKSDREALGKFKGLTVRYLQAPDEWRQCGGHTASARCTRESSNDSTLSSCVEMWIQFMVEWF